MTKGKGRNPGASGLNKHIKRKDHKERSQPAARRHLGQLEKHKDHVLRARKRKVKVKRLQEIKRAAAQRNPDEYNMGMTKAVMDIATGKYKKRHASLTADARADEIKKSMVKSARDVQYLEYKANADKARAKDLLNEDVAAALTATAPSNKHLVFAEDEGDFRHFDAQKFFDATPEMLRQHPATRGTISVLRDTVLPEEILLSGGNHMKSLAQRRKERREVQRLLRRRGLTGADAEGERARLVERLREKKDMRRYRFVDMVEEDAEQREQARRAAATAAATAEGGGLDAAGEQETVIDPVAEVMALRRKRESDEILNAARRAKEIAQRVDRSKSLSALAKNVRHQIGGMKKQLDQKSNSRFKPKAQRRAR